jgi:hypothetical protein
MTVADRLAEVRARLAGACERAGRDPAEIAIVAVSKLQPDRLVQEAIDAGVTDLGENRVAGLLTRLVAHPDARWHLVGQLQSRKAKDIVGRAALVHSLDRRKLADALDRHARDRGVVQEVLVQVDFSGEPGRGGTSIDRVESLVAYAAELPGVRVTGLMTIPPLEADARDAFRALRQLRDDLAPRWSHVTELSMGMSHDLEIAVEEGATIIRPGTAIFGERPAGQGGQQTG